MLIERKSKKVENQTKSEGIFVEKDGYIYEVKMIFNHMDIVNAIEEYIGMISIYTFEVKSEEMLANERFNTNVSRVSSISII